MVRKELTKEQNKIIINLSNNNCKSYATIHCECVKCKSALRMQVSDAMEISTKRGKFSSNWQTTEI